ncbi:MAG: hypothetical protein LKG14_07335 [Prevotella sp.]|jgi:hypothetical protein|nr:hypothetical protein [Prevotella sp.]
MKIQIFVLFLITNVATAYAQKDSTITKSLQDVVVKGKGQIETAGKVIYSPTTREKKHAANGFDLINVMQMAELDVSPQTKSITTKSGGEVVLCINGMAALPEDVATLRANNILSIEYIRTPTGKYAGKAGLINFITKQLKYGGNVYLSANEGFAYKNGDYLGFTDFTINKLTLSVTASGDWNHDHSYTDGQDVFQFANNTTLTHNFTNEYSLHKSNHQTGRVKLTATGNKYRFVSYLNITRQGEPYVGLMMNNQYTGRYTFLTKRQVTTNSQNLAPSLYAAYTVWLPHNQSLDLTGSFLFGHNKYHSNYNETGQSAMSSMVTENNDAFKGIAQYSKSWKSGVTLSGYLTNDHNRFKDIYAGSSTGTQRLITDVTRGLVKFSGSNEKYYYYVTAGVSNSAVSLNGTHYNYFVPVAFYGFNYALNRNQAFSLDGLFTHTLFDPSTKNSMTVPTSFFEAVRGNPNMTPIKIFGNTLVYNGQFGKSKISISYDNSIYFKNVVHQYTASNDTIYNARINDGNFYGNMLTSTYTYSAFHDKLLLSTTVLDENNVIRGKIYKKSKNDVRLIASVTYLEGDWMMKFDYHSSYTSLDIREPYLIRCCPCYELTVSWNHKAWAVEAFINNPFSKYDDRHITMDYGCYQRDTWSYNEPDGCNLNLKLTYSIGYGKKEKRDDLDINKNINSAIMRNL